MWEGRFPMSKKKERKNLKLEGDLKKDISY